VIVWSPDPVLIEIGPVTIRWYGLLFAIALMGAFHIWRWQALRGGRTEKEAEALLTIGVIATIVGTRLGHVFFYDAARYLHHPITILYFWKGGLSSHGGTIGLAIGLGYFSWRYKMHYVETLDRFSMGAAWAAFCVRLGNLVNSEIVGRVTDVSWAFKFPRHDRGLPLDQVPWRHPSQIYEMALGLFVLAVLYLVDRKLGEKRPLGLLASLFFLLYFSGRFCVEFFKAYQTLRPTRSPITMGQTLSIPFIIVGAVGLVYVLKRARAEKAEG